MSRYFAVAMNGSHETKGLLFLLGLTKNNFLIHRIYSGSIIFVFIVPFSTKKKLIFHLYLLNLKITKCSKDYSKTMMCFVSINIHCDGFML